MTGRDLVLDDGPDPLGLVEGAPWVIGLCGPAGSGKSTAAAILEAHGFVRVRFAGPLKSMMRACLEAFGAPPAQVAQMIEGELKELPCDMLGGRSPRHAMQTLGDEWGRGQIDRDFWARLGAAQIAGQLAAGRRVVVEDLRYPNEAAAIRASAPAAELWRLEGRGGIAGGHASERQALPPPDRVLENAGTVDALEAQILAAILG